MPLSVNRMMYRVLAIGLAIIVCTTSIMGATVASLDDHPYWYVSRISAILSGLSLVAINMLNKNKDIKILKYGAIAVLIGIITSLASLTVINNYVASLVSNRSYGHIMGNFVIIFLVIGLGMLLSKVKHLTRPFS
jgi:Ni/Fe-hydrogenase subunit HybB-like protein